MNSMVNGNSCCTRNTSINSTMENHCHRERRSLSTRPGNRSRLPKSNLFFGVAGAQARIHATAKKPASSNSRKIVRSLMDPTHYQPALEPLEVGRHLWGPSEVINPALRLNPAHRGGRPAAARSAHCARVRTKLRARKAKPGQLPGSSSSTLCLLIGHCVVSGGNRALESHALEPLFDVEKRGETNCRKTLSQLRDRD